MAPPRQETDEEKLYRQTVCALSFSTVVQEVNRGTDQKVKDRASWMFVLKAVHEVTEMNKSDTAKSTDAKDQAPPTSKGKQESQDVADGSAQAEPTERRPRHERSRSK